MQWFEIATIVVAIVLPIVLAILAERRSIKKLDKHLNFGDDEQSMARQLGVSEKSITAQLGVNEKSITSQLGVNSKSITSQLGVDAKSITSQLGVDTNEKSLTLQHKDIISSCTNIYNLMADINNVLHDSQVSRQNANTAQANLAVTLEAFQQSFVTAINENQVLKAENAQLRQTNERLTQQIQQFTENGEAESNGENFQS